MLWSMREGCPSAAAPVLVMIGDGDIILPEHAVDLFRLLPRGQFSVLPMTDHFGPMTRPDWLLPVLDAFFRASAVEEARL